MTFLKIICEHNFSPVDFCARMRMISLKYNPSFLILWNITLRTIYMCIFLFVKQDVIIATVLLILEKFRTMTNMLII